MTRLGKHRVDLIDCVRMTKFDILFTKVFSYYIIGDVYLELFTNIPTTISEYMYYDNNLTYTTGRTNNLCRTNFAKNYFLFDPSNTFPEFYQNTKSIEFYNTQNTDTNIYSYYSNRLIMYSNQFKILPHLSNMTPFNSSSPYGLFIGCFNDNCALLTLSKTKSGYNAIILFSKNDANVYTKYDLPRGICYILNYDFSDQIILLAFIQQNQIVVQTYNISDDEIVKDIDFTTNLDFPIEQISALSKNESSEYTYIYYTTKSKILPNPLTESYNKVYHGYCKNSNNNNIYLLYSDTNKKFGNKSIYLGQSRYLLLTLNTLNFDKVSVTFWINPVSNNGTLFNAGDIILKTSSIQWGDESRDLSISINTWSMFTLTNDGKIYINDQLIIDDLPTYDFSTITDFWALCAHKTDNVGEYTDLGTSYFDEFRVYSTVLTLDEVNNLYSLPTCNTLPDPLHTQKLITLFTFEDIYQYYKELELYKITIEPNSYSVTIDKQTLDKRIRFNNVNDNTSQLRINLSDNPVTSFNISDISNNTCYIANIIKVNNDYNVLNQQIFDNIKNIVFFPTFTDKDKKIRKLGIMYDTTNAIIPMVYDHTGSKYYCSERLNTEPDDVTYIYNLDKNIVEVMRLNNSLKRYYFEQYSLIVSTMFDYIFDETQVAIYSYDYNKDKLIDKELEYIGTNITFVDSGTNSIKTTTNSINYFTVSDNATVINIDYII